jgi:hypothetical protein
MLMRAESMASASTELLATCRAMFSARTMGTPPDSRVERVRVKRAMEISRLTLPSTGTRRRTRS